MPDRQPSLAGKNSRGSARPWAGGGLRCVTFSLLLAAPLHLLVGCGRASSSRGGDEDRAPIPVELVQPERLTLPRMVRATGSLYGEDETTIAAEVAGRVIEIARDLGDPVREGEVLVRLDPMNFVLQRDERINALRQTLAQLGLVELPGEGFNVDSVPTVVAARAQAENARARAERGRLLAERTPPLISEQDYADLRTQADVAESALQTARLEAQARLAEARTLEAQVRLAEKRLADTVVRAPGDAASALAAASPTNDPMAGAASDGGGSFDAALAARFSVAERRVSVGDFVQVGQPLVRLVDVDPIKLRVRVVERRIGTVRVGQPASIRIEAFPRPFEGVVARVSPVVDESTRSFLVEIVVPNEARLLKPGSFATAEIAIGDEEATVVPASALVTFAGIHKLLSVKDGAVHELRVEPGARIGDGPQELVEIRTALPEGVRLIRRPSGSLVQGVPVREGAAETEVAP